jgi:hypothetical protein
MAVRVHARTIQKPLARGACACHQLAFNHPPGFCSPLSLEDTLLKHEFMAILLLKADSAVG